MDYTYISDLDAHVAELAQAGHPTEHVRGRAIFTDERIKVLVFPFEAGQTLEEHTAPHPAILHFLQGKADVTLGNDVREARAGTWIHLPAHLPHSIHARTPVVMQLLILPGPPSTPPERGRREALVKKRHVRNPGVWSRP